MSKLFGPPTIGVVLAGGLSRRMGGGDKFFRVLDDHTLLDRVVQRLQPQCTELILNANGDPARFSKTGLVVIADAVPDFAGPLAGILAALDWSAINRPAVDWVVSAAADSPFLPYDYTSRLHDVRARTDAQLACARTDTRTHPVNGLWSVALREDLRRALTTEGLRKIDNWTARHGVVTADWSGEPYDPFFNVNTPEDLSDAARLVELFPNA